MVTLSVIYIQTQKYFQKSSYQNRQQQMESNTNPEKGKQKNCQFIDKLLDMMEKYPEHLYWTKDGQQLIITHLQEVETKILPDYFRHQNFASFVRQLNMYGFCKKEKSPEFLRFSHKIFKENNQNAFHQIQRKAKIRNIKNSSQKFFQSNSKLISKIKQKSGLNSQAQEVTISLLNYKDNIQDTMKKIKFQLDKLFLQVKDSRSKNVIQTVNVIQRQCYQSIVKSLAKGKQIDDIVFEQFKSQIKNQTQKKSQNQQNQQNEFQNQYQQCSLQEQLQQNIQNESINNQRFQMQEQELSGFNQFNNNLNMNMNLNHLNININTSRNNININPGNNGENI